MNKVVKLTALLSMGILQGFAQGGKMSIVKGNVDKSYVTTVYLYRVVDGTLSEIGEQPLNAGHDYAFAVPDVHEGFYYVGDGLKGEEVRTRIYLKGGEQIDLNLHQAGYDMTGGSPENTLLDKWQQLSAQIMVPAYQFWTDRVGYSGFFPKFTAFLPQADAFKQTIHTGNEAFDSLMRFVVQNDVESAALEFIFTPRVVHPQWSELPAFYQTIRKDKKFTDAQILQLGDGGTNRISIYSSFCTRMDNEDGKAIKDMSRIQRFQMELDRFGNDTVKGAYLVGALRMFRDSSSLDSVRARFGQYLVTDSLKGRFFTYEKNLATFSKGEKGFNFTMTDSKDQTVSMSDLKGKYVVVDVWATWCGPCKEEMPYFQKMEEEMKGKNVTFVGISVDKEQDKAKWAQMIADQKMGGIQLFMGERKDFATYYKVNTIPRFMVFDPQGRIVNAEAPRPSEPELKALLLKCLSQ